MNKLLELVTSTLKKNWRHFLSCRQFLILPEHAGVRTESPFLPALFHSDSKYFPHSLLLYFSLYPFSFSLILFFYSVLSAVTGSLFAAFLDGMMDITAEDPMKDFGNFQQQTMASVRGQEETTPFRVGTFYFSKPDPNQKTGEPKPAPPFLCAL